MGHNLSTVTRIVAEYQLNCLAFITVRYFLSSVVGTVLVFTMYFNGRDKKKTYPFFFICYGSFNHVKGFIGEKKKYENSPTWKNITYLHT